MVIKDYDDAKATMVRVAYLADEAAEAAAKDALAVMTYASKATRLAPHKRYALWFEAQSAIEYLYLRTILAPADQCRSIVTIRGEGSNLTPPPK
jgi:hypothetical protein